ncbi:hypothetical protein PR048_007191 [Dryococelus australis]|uniref:Uncharacterized protein n=1 Tax=Dryococelus australis TaxID=614101 RepID=A0ABQ9IE66_9NEOP|nr:hypothetical protein PR048_007191 [Dryococelus australis]
MNFACSYAAERNAGVLPAPTSITRRAFCAILSPSNYPARTAKRRGAEINDEPGEKRKMGKKKCDVRHCTSPPGGASSRFRRTINEIERKIIRTLLSSRLPVAQSVGAPSIWGAGKVSEEVWTALSIEVLRADEGEARRVWGSAGMQESGKREIPEKIRERPRRESNHVRTRAQSRNKSTSPTDTERHSSLRSKNIHQFSEGNPVTRSVFQKSNTPLDAGTAFPGGPGRYHITGGHSNLITEIPPYRLLAPSVCGCADCNGENSADMSRHWYMPHVYNSVRHSGRHHRLVGRRARRVIDGKTARQFSALRVEATRELDVHVSVAPSAPALLCLRVQNSFNQQVLSVEQSTLLSFTARSSVFALAIQPSSDTCIMKSFRFIRLALDLQAHINSQRIRSLSSPRGSKPNWAKKDHRNKPNWAKKDHRNRNQYPSTPQSTLPPFGASSRTCDSLRNLPWKKSPTAQYLNFSNIADSGTEVSTEQRRNAKAGEKEDPRENPPTSDIGPHDSLVRPGVTPPGIGPGSPMWGGGGRGANSLATEPPRPLTRRYTYFAKHEHESSFNFSAIVRLEKNSMTYRQGPATEDVRRLPPRGAAPIGATVHCASSNAIDTKLKVLKWRAVFSSYCEYLWDFRRTLHFTDARSRRLYTRWSLPSPLVDLLARRLSPKVASRPNSRHSQTVGSEARCSYIVSDARSGRFSVPRVMLRENRSSNQKIYFDKRRNSSSEGRESGSPKEANRGGTLFRTHDETQLAENNFTTNSSTARGFDALPSLGHDHLNDICFLNKNLSSTSAECDSQIHKQPSARSFDVSTIVVAGRLEGGEGVGGSWVGKGKGMPSSTEVDLRRCCEDDRYRNWATAAQPSPAVFHRIFRNVGHDRTVVEVNMEWRRNEGAGETGDPPEDPPTNGIVRHDSHFRKSGVTRPGIEPGSPWWEASALTAQPPWPH